MPNRIGTRYIIDNSVYYLQNNQVQFQNLQNQIASGLKVIRPSDDPIGASRINNLNIQKSQSQSYLNNINDGLSELNTADIALRQTNDLIDRASELAIQGSNSATISTTVLPTLKTEVSKILDQLVQIGNTSYGNQSIFSGYKTDTKPFTRTGDDVAHSGSPSTSYERNIEISKGLSAQVNLDGLELFGTATVTGTTAAGSGLFQTLSQLKLDMENNNYDGIRASLDKLAAGKQVIQKNQSELGARVNQLELAQNRLEETSIIIEKEMSGLQNTDLSKAISDLNYQQTVYQASLSVTSKIFQKSLVNLL
jgi:flagellar hook-associated protein 3 FlgL